MNELRPDHKEEIKNLYRNINHGLKRAAKENDSEYVDLFLHMLTIVGGLMKDFDIEGGSK